MAKSVEVFEDLTFEKYFRKFYIKLVQCEDNKYLPPKFSNSIKDLANHFAIRDIPMTDDMSI